MCVITDRNHIVVSISLIPGLGNMPVGFHMYFPVIDVPMEGSFYNPEGN